MTCLVDANGDALERYTNDPYGESMVFTPTYSLRNSSDYNVQFLFTGRRLDRETGLYYFRSRYFHTKVGSFVGRDTLGNVDGMNLYASYFVPSGTDPTGNETFRECFEACIRRADPDKRHGEVFKKCEEECKDCPGIEEVIPGACDCKCPGGLWDTKEGYALSSGWLIGGLTMGLTAVCRAKPKLWVEVEGSFFGGGLLTAFGARFTVEGSVSGAPDCAALSLPTIARIYSISGIVAGGSAVFIGASDGTYYNLFSIGINKNLKKLVKAPVNVWIARGSISITKKSCVKRRWIIPKK